MRDFSYPAADRVGFQPQAWKPWDLGVTIGFMGRRGSTGAYHTVYYSGPNGGAVNGDLQMGFTDMDDHYIGCAGSQTTVAATVSAIDWCIFWSKAPGSAIPRVHFGREPFNPTNWTHANGGAALSNPGTTAQALEEFGRWNGTSDPWGGGVEWFGIWSMNLTDNEYERFPYYQPQRLATMFPIVQRFYWFNQQAVTTPIRCLANSGADQINITGTSVAAPRPLQPGFYNAKTLVPPLLTVP